MAPTASRPTIAIYKQEKTRAIAEAEKYSFINFKTGSMNMQKQLIPFSIDEKIIKNISKSIAGEVADSIYYEFLIARYTPEIMAIENGSVVPLRSGAFKQQLMQRIKSMAE